MTPALSSPSHRPNPQRSLRSILWSRYAAPVNAASGNGEVNARPTRVWIPLAIASVAGVAALALSTGRRGNKSDDRRRHPILVTSAPSRRSGRDSTPPGGPVVWDRALAEGAKRIAAALSRIYAPTDGPGSEAKTTVQQADGLLGVRDGLRLA
jgi:hypothetical protein